MSRIYSHIYANNRRTIRMDLEKIGDFFFWCMVVNTGIYVVTTLAAILMRNFVYATHRKLFNLDTKSVDKLTQNYLSNFKLLITVFNFTPWIAILIIK